MLNDAKGSLKARIGPWLHFLIYCRPDIDDSMGILGRDVCMLPWCGQSPLGYGCEPSGYGTPVRWHRRPEKAWRDFLESGILSGTTALSLAKNKIWKVSSSAVAGRSSLPEADWASHRFQCESSTQTSVCRLWRQLFSHEKKWTWRAGSETQETTLFLHGGPLACTKVSQRRVGSLLSSSSETKQEKSFISSGWRDSPKRSPPWQKSPVSSSYLTEANPSCWLEACRCACCVVSADEVGFAKTSSIHKGQ